MPFFAGTEDARLSSGDNSSGPTQVRRFRRSSRIELIHPPEAIPFTLSDDGWELDDTTDQSFSKLRKKKKKPIKQNDRPRWQDTDVTTMYVVDLGSVRLRAFFTSSNPVSARFSSDNEDNDIQIIEHTSTNPCPNPSPKKRKRSRSISLTPPPELPAHQRANAMDIVRFVARHTIVHHLCLHGNLRQALAVPPRPPSPIFVDDPIDVIDLDPELAKIAEAARQRVKHAYIDPERTGGPETANIKVRWRPHPRDPSAQEQWWPFQMRRVRIRLPSLSESNVVLE